MGQKKYLYGAAVQGIQGFIFQTNKLQEIVGASELVEEICTTEFEDSVGNYKEYDGESGAVLHAAGNIKYIFCDEEACAKVVRIFPKRVANFAPGVTISQAVVAMEGEYSSFKEAVNELERRLRIQRNKPMRSSTLGLMGIERSRQTGLPVVEVKKVKRYGEEVELHLDSGSKAKLENVVNLKLCKAAFGEDVTRDTCTPDIEQIPSKNDWIAIIHADGNGMGQVVQKVGTKPDKFRDFSQKLDEATKAAAKKAYERVKREYGILGEQSRIIPIRPIVLSGDDFTVVCRADLALDYAVAFIENFEMQTREKLNPILAETGVFPQTQDKRLTACAGIAYIKSSYPFYYGYELAETLCSVAKKDAKNKQSIREGNELPDSCVMFHKVQDSFVEEWDMVVNRELKPQDNIDLCFGPYYLDDKRLLDEHEGKWSVKQLCEAVQRFSKDDKENNAVKSHLRKWLSLLHTQPEMAEQYQQRFSSLLSEDQLSFVRKIVFDFSREGKFRTPAYDILSLNAVINQNTKEA